MSEEAPERRFRTLFISDVHLGARGSQADRLLDFLRSHDADTIYLVGDIVDGWALQSGWHWPQSHNDFVQKMLRKARKGSRVIYVPGNHDEFLRNYYGTHFGGIGVVAADLVTAFTTTPVPGLPGRVRKRSLVDPGQAKYAAGFPSDRSCAFCLANAPDTRVGTRSPGQLCLSFSRRTRLISAGQ